MLKSPHVIQVISLFSAVVGFITSFSERSRTPVVSFGETREIKGSLGEENERWVPMIAFILTRRANITHLLDFSFYLYNTALKFQIKVHGTNMYKLESTANKYLIPIVQTKTYRRV